MFTYETYTPFVILIPYSKKGDVFLPTTRKESIYFGTMMCFGMVMVMSFYNLFLNGGLGHLSISAILGQLAIGFIVALILDLFLIGPLARKVAFKLPFDKSKKLYVVLAMSTCMVLGMASCMSLFGLFMSYAAEGFHSQNVFKDYGMTFLKNVVVAFPLQLLVMGPLVRGLFVKFVQGRSMVKAAS